MSSVLFQFPSFDKFLARIQKFFNKTEAESRLRFIASRKIQALVKGFLIRRYIQKLNRAALTIQRYYRGWRGRIIYQIRLKEAAEEVYVSHYNKMATRIQKTWRGYVSRRDVFSYYALKAWILSVQNKNNDVLSKIKKDEEELAAKKLEEFENESKRWVVFILSKLHHLIRTKTIAGIFSKKYSSELSEFEELLKSVQYKRYMIELRKYYNKLVKTKKPIPKSGQYLQSIGYSDLYWYLDDNDIEKMFYLGAELKYLDTDPSIVKHPKDFTTNINLSCQERQKKLFVKSVFAEDTKKQPSLARKIQPNISPIKFKNFVRYNEPVTISTLNYIDYHINVMLYQSHTGKSIV